MVIAHELWAGHFNRDPSIIGKTFVLSDEPFTVIGVMPPGFDFETGSLAWLAASRYLDPSTGTSRRSAFVMARLVPGATPSALALELRSLEASANEGRPDRLKTTFGAAPLRTRYVRATQSRDLVLAAIVGCIVLIACANVGGLVLVRTMGYRRELAVRAAIGAGMPRIARDLFVQNLLLAMAGLAIGFGLAALALDFLRAASLSSLAASGMEYRLDARVAAFAAVLTIAIATVLSVAPLRLLLRTDLQQALREGSHRTTTARGSHRTQQLFVIVQTACAVALLVGTGLMVRTMLRFGRVQLGYDAARVAQVTPVPAHAGRTPERFVPLAEQLLRELAEIPGVELTGLRTSVPIVPAGAREVPRLRVAAARTLSPGQQPRSAYGVSPDYFTVMGIPVVEGRVFTLTDTAGAPAVAVVNEWAARHWWPGEPAVGQTIVIEGASQPPIAVVGVVRDTLAAQGSVLLAAPGPELYRPFAQANHWVATFFARTVNPSGRLVDEMQRTVMRHVPNGRPRAGVLAAQVEGQLRAVQTSALEIGGAAAVGLLLAITGLYGVLSYVVQARTTEIGIRGVLGAGRRQILGMVMGQALRLAAAGVAIGLAAAALLSRSFASLLYGTPPADPLVYIWVACLFLMVALAASGVPALRATRVDPAIALRG
jgi:predicted permease